jgi:hypothetical protein
MTKEEMKEFCKWALNDEWLAQFKITSVYDSNVKLFSVSKECRPGGYFLKIISEDDFYTFKKNKECDLYFEDYFGDDITKNFGDEDLAALKSRNLKDSKKYVYDLVKWGIKQYIKQKNSEIISKLNEL